MKKFFVIIAVLALTLVSSVAMAEVTMDGSIEFLMRSLKNTNDWNDKATNTGDYRQTYERVRLGINAKNDGVNGRIQIENDWDPWGRFETAQAYATTKTTVNTGPSTSTTTTSDAGRLKVREAWLNFVIPGAGAAHVKVGHQFLQLGNGWFFRSNKYGSDAWVVGLPGKNTIAFVDVKVYEGDASRSDDVDAYVLLDTFKIDDKSAVGAYLVQIKARGSVGAEETTLNTLGLHYNGMLGSLKLAAEADFQSGEIKDLGAGTKIDLSGNQFVLQAGMAMDALAVRATAAMGSGDDGTDPKKFKQINTFLDKDPHFALVYEYHMVTAALNPDTSAYDQKNTGFANTTAFGLGADFKVSKMFTVGADFWMLQASKKVSVRGDAADKDLGNEIDVKVNATIYDQLTWNTTIGYFMPGKAYELAGKADAVQVVQSTLSYKF